jgi:hypothetical protein
MAKTAPAAAQSGMRCMRGTAVFLALWLGLSVLAVVGCTVSLIAPYDEATVNSVTALLKKTDTFLIQQQSYLESGQQSMTTYEHNQPWYNEVQVDLNAIIVRAQAIPKNQNTVNQLSKLQTAFNDLISQNKQGFSKEYLAIAQMSVNQLIGAILAAEFAKKQK